MIVFAIIMLWCACIVLFLSSKHQKIQKNCINKYFATLIFILLVALSISMLSSLHRLTAAVIIAFVYIVTMLLFIIFTNSYFRNKLLIFISIGGAFYGVLGASGYYYVS